jgi:hypothetical protein
MMKLLNFFNLPGPSSRTMAHGLAQPLTEMNTRRYFWGAVNLTAIYEPTV